jgi:hypothetical protein
MWTEAMFIEGRLRILDIWLTILQIRQSQVRGEILESICRMAGARRLGRSSWCLARGSQANVYIQEWALWKIIVSTVTLKLFYDG